MRPSSASTYSRPAERHPSRATTGNGDLHIMNISRGGIVTGWGISVPDKIVTNDDLSVTMDTNDAWIRGADRHPRAPDRRHHLPAGHRGRVGRPGQGRPATGRDRRGDPRHHHPRPDRAGHLGHRAGRHRRARRGLRRQCRVLRIRLRPGRGPRDAGHRGRAAAGHRLGDPEPDHRLGRPVGGRAGRRRGRRGGAGGGRRSGPAALVEPRRRRLAPSPAQVRPRRLPLHGRQGDLPQGGAGGGGVGRAGHRRGRADHRRHRPDGATPGQPPDHQRRLPALGHPRGEGGGGHRPLRQHLVGVHPAGPGRRPGDRSPAGGPPCPAHRLRWAA